jgi:hypothetical protein
MTECPILVSGIMIDEATAPLSRDAAAATTQGNE